MSVDLKGKITLFVEYKEANGYRFPVFSTTLTKEYTEEGKKISLKVQVYFAKTRYSREVLETSFHEDNVYTIVLKNAFLSIRSYFNKEGNEIVEPCIHILQHELLKATPIDKEKREVARTLAKMQEEAPNVLPSPISDDDLDDIPF